MFILIQSLIVYVSNKLSEDQDAASSQITLLVAKHQKVYRKMVRQQNVSKYYSRS